MSQIHRRFTDEQVKVLFQGYCQGQFARIDLQELLGIGKSRFRRLPRRLSPRVPGGRTLAAVGRPSRPPPPGGRTRNPAR